MRTLHRGLAITFVASWTAVVSSQAQEQMTVPPPAGDGYQMIRIPAGRFTMGITEEQERSLWQMEGADVEVYHGILEESAHDVFVDGFYIGKYEVTVAQWNAYAQAVGVALRTMPDDHPAPGMSWQDAHDYCTWAGLRLPTEAEWERAARGDDGRLFPWGNLYIPEGGNSYLDADGYSTTSPVGSYESGASPYGVHDMGGNVWEWVMDWFGEGYYSQGSQFNPSGPPSGNDKLARGGSSVSGPLLLRATVRAPGPPTTRAGPAGIRCARNDPGAFRYPHVTAASVSPSAIGLMTSAEITLSLQLDQPLENTGLSDVVYLDALALGLADEIALSPVEPGMYEAPLQVDPLSTGRFAMAVRCRDGHGEHFIMANVYLNVWPTLDRPIMVEGLAADWTLEEFGPESSDIAHTQFVHEGLQAMAITVDSRSGIWGLTYRPVEPVEEVGYLLRFAFHPGNSVPPSRVRLRVGGDGQTVDLLAAGMIDLSLPEWQLVEIPVDHLVEIGAPLTKLLISGSLNGTFYIDDLRLAAPRLPSPATAVLETRLASVPFRHQLIENYPNPFNSQTVVRYTVTETIELDLAIFNMLGQRVATLITGIREAGSFSAHWDGTDDTGRPLASGPYLLRLQTDQQILTSKLMLLR